jgi:hypothetical protein
MQKRIGKIIKPADANIRPWEEATAQSLALVGYDVEFIRKSNRDRETSADAYVNSEKWEFKAPNGHKMGLVERNLRNAVLQSDSVVFDSRRVNYIPDKALARELSAQFGRIKNLRRLKFINRHGEVIDIQ